MHVGRSELRTTYLVGIAMTLLGIVLIVVSLSLPVAESSGAAWSSTNATVLSYESQRFATGSKLRTIRVEHLVYAYSVDGRSYKVRTDARLPYRARPGDEIIVWYDSGHPGRSRLSQPGSEGGGGREGLAGLLGAGIALAALGLLVAGIARLNLRWSERERGH